MEQLSTLTNGLLSDTFTLGVVVGIAVGVFARWATRFLAMGVVVIAIVELLAQAGAL